MKKVNKNVTQSVDTIRDKWYYIFVTKKQRHRKGGNADGKEKEKR
nr:MAG TPA: hypothetical protein [Caudoviricetes sp.]